MHKVNDYQTERSWKNIDRNWKRSTFYTGIMAFYEATGDSVLLWQAVNWSKKHAWRIGTEWYYPANRLTCVQVYLEIYFQLHEHYMISQGKEFMDSRVMKTELAYKQGWDYIDALYVGPPAYAMMSKATNDKKYIDYMNRMFWELADWLYEPEDSLFYRDIKAKTKETSKSGNKVIWSRGNGWVMASLPRILTYLPQNNSKYPHYLTLFRNMAASLAHRQGDDGMWRTNLDDYEDYPNPESSGTAFFTYAMTWGINEEILDPEIYKPVVLKAWKALYSAVDENGKVCYGQPEARGPGNVSKEDSDEFVSGAFLLAGSEILKLRQHRDD